MHAITILPSEKAAERKRREVFAGSDATVTLDETIFSLSHFLKTVTITTKPVLTRPLQKHFIFYCLKKNSLRYFEKLKHSPGLANAFLTTIRQLKRHNISPEHLEGLLKETGSLKEFDLLKTYERYEALKKEKDVLDEEDIYQLPIQNIPCENLVLENFFESYPALDSFLSQFKFTFKTPDIPKPEVLKQAHLFSLPSPHQETDWFLMRLQNLLEEGVAIHQIGIFMGGIPKNYDPIWKKMEAMGLVEGETPFLKWRERAEGRLALLTASQINSEDAFLTEWIDRFLAKTENKDIANLLEPLRFLNHVLNIGKLKRQEWLEWIKENLDQSPQTKIRESLNGIQWMEPNGGDFVPLKYFWVPQMLEGTFPSLSASPFFQDKRDRSRKEWNVLCEAFPEPQDLFEKKRAIFLYQLSLAKEAWLTYPRRDSFGQDLGSSPFTWDFSEAENIKEVAPLFFGQETLNQKLKIEKERLSDDLKTDAFHANFKDNPLLQQLGPQKKEHIFSPSRLETYAQCPFKYFSNRVLNIPQEKEYSPQVDPEDRGTLFHNCLEKFLKEHGNLFLEARQETTKEKELFETLGKVIEEVFREMTPQMVYANAELYQHLKQKTLEQATLLLQNELEESRNIDSPLTPTHFEWGFGTSLENSLDIGDIHLGGRIDRIDCDDASKNFLVLDYKTGNSATTRFQDKLLNGLSLQLPIYITAVQKLLLQDYTPIGGMLISTKLGERKQGLLDSQFNKTHFLMRKGSKALLETEDMKQTIEATMKMIKNYVEKIRSGYFSAEPKDCKASCDYKDICRYPLKPFE
ncbi:MAG: hypothetical protein A3H42_02230 [Deltaproteobacteria bacterium RIFCSPLOWO2_02_FULL_46_8]|nr:MAG: hypothetical protein A3H42_02230 [Deltaproteobacteria bacterium RIFCSPLOWO2_02_FULL_46_8]